MNVFQETQVNFSQEIQNFPIDNKIQFNQLMNTYVIILQLSLIQKKTVCKSSFSESKVFMSF